MHFARRPKVRYAPSNSGGVARTRAFLLALGTAFVSSCILNPQPEPPSRGSGSSHDAPPTAFGGSGGAATGGSGVGGSAGGAGGGAGTGGSINVDGGVGSGGAAGSAGSSGTTDSGIPSGPCRAARDCALESACFANTGTCAPVPTADCAPPTDEGGPNLRLAVCNAASACAQGLTCVPLAQVLGPSGAYDAGPNGVCLTACNPCAPTECSLGETCFARTPGRGFCALGLLAEGAPCGYAVTPAPCAAGLTCAEVFEQAGRTCVRHCRPDAAAEVSAHADHSASPSVECRAGEVCFETDSSSRAETPTDFACISGTLVDDGGTCGDDRYCRPPAACVAGVCTL